MTPNARTLQIIKGWLTNLVDVTQHKEAKPASATLDVYAALLGRTHPSAAFTAESLAFVVDRQAWFPAVAVISEKLGAWWQNNKPRSAPALDDLTPRPPGWNEGDTQWLAYWHKRVGDLRTEMDHAKREEARANLRSLVRSKSPRAWQHITGSREAVHVTPTAETIAKVHAHLRGDGSSLVAFANAERENPPAWADEPF